MAKWYDDSLSKNDIVISTRVRLARNLKDYPFPRKIGNDDAKKVIDIVESALKRASLGFSRTDMESLSAIDKQRLVEKRYISPNLAKQTKPAALFLSGDESLSVMVNEEDHIRMQAIFSGFECSRAYEIISKLDECMAETIGYATHVKYGYLTSCLTNVGTGMRISCMLHLPAICKSNLANTLFPALSKLGVAVRGMYGEGSNASGYIFQISNQMTLGVSEKEIADKINDVVNQLVAKERELRRTLFKESPETMEDKIMRSVGILKSARLLSTKEMMELFSNVRMGISLGLIEDISPSKLNFLMVETSPCHLEKGENSPVQRDIERAKIVRNKLSEV